MDPQTNMVLPEIDSPATPVPPFPIPAHAQNQSLPLPPRNLVLCLDGTSNKFSARNTNVVKLFSMLEISPGYKAGGQMAYYDSGVGTYLPTGASSSWSQARQAFGKTMDLAVAWQVQNPLLEVALPLRSSLVLFRNFDDHVKSAYKWLMDYYQPHDKIFIFGFSRGAYAARALAGMIQKVGLLPAGNHSQIPLAYDVYKAPWCEDKGADVISPNHLARRYRGIFGISRGVVVHFIGVWDTVSSLGGLSAPDRPFANAVGSVTYFRQALALDERRVKFQPEFRESNKHEFQGALNGIARNKEVWFLGVHTSVGGGSDPDVDPSLANIPFRWMLAEAVECGLRTGAINILRANAIRNVPTVLRYIQQHFRDIYDTYWLYWLSGIIRYPEETSLDSDSEYYGNVDRLEALFSHDHRKKVIRLAAEYDTTMSPISQEADAGFPVTRDLLSDKHESLAGVGYLFMDYAFPLLQCRRYRLENEKYIEIRSRGIHGGDGRYIQHDQKIHRSVLKRLLYDQAVNEQPDWRPAIEAHIPPVVGAKRINHWDFARQDEEDHDVQPWVALMLEKNRKLELWEGSSTPIQYD